MSSSSFPPAAINSPTLNNALLNSGARETVYITSGNISWWGGMRTDVAAVWYFQGNSQSWSTFNITTNVGTLLSLLSVGQSTTAVVLFTQGSTGYLPTQFYVDNQATTVKWLGGSAPTASANAIDALTFTVTKTGTSSWILLGSFAKYA